MWNWTFAVKKETKARPEQIWRLWENVAGWPKWDKELEWAKLDGPFVKGARGELKPKGWVKSAFVTTEVRPNILFSDETKMPFTRLKFHHSIEKVSENRYAVTHRVEAEGLLAPLLRFTLRKKLVKGLPRAMDKLIAMAEHVPI